MFDKEEKPNASKKETDGAAAFPVYAAGDAANDRFCGGCTGCANKSEAGTDRNRLKSLLEEKPELKEALDGLLSVYEISIRQNGEPVEIKDSAMTVRIPMNSHLEGYAHYQAVRVDGEPERIEAKAEDGSLVFEAGGPGRYAVLGSDTPFSVSAIIQPTRCRETKRMETPSTSFCWPRYRRLSCWRCCLYSYTGKSGRHRITRQPEERIRPNRTAEIPKN